MRADDMAGVVRLSSSLMPISVSKRSSSASKLLSFRAVDFYLCMEAFRSMERTVGCFEICGVAGVDGVSSISSMD